MTTRLLIIDAQARLAAQLDRAAKRCHAEVAKIFQQSRREQGLIRLVPDSDFVAAPKNHLLKSMMFVHDGRPFSEYPQGTRAISICGSFWYRVGFGWRWNGTSFQEAELERPGATWTGMMILPRTQRRDELEGMYSRNKPAMAMSKAN